MRSLEGTAEAAAPPSSWLLPTTRFPPTSQHQQQQRGLPQGMLGGLGSDHRARCGEGEEMDPSNLSLQCGGANWPRSAEFKFHHKENRMHEETIGSLWVD